MEDVYASLDEIGTPKMRERLAAGRESALLSKDLVTLCDTAPLPIPLSQLDHAPLDYPKLLEFARTHGFRARMACPGGREVIRRRRKQGRKNLVPTTYKK